MRARTLTAAVLLLGLAAMPAGAASKRALRSFKSCPQLLSYARTHGKTAVGTGWVPTPFTVGAQQPSRVPKSSGTSKGGPSTTTTAEDQAGAPQASGGEGTSTDFSTTNVQEQGVDEPDIVKTDGTTIFAVVNGVLHSIDARGAEPKLLDTLQLDEGYGHELLLHGDRLLVVQNAWLDESQQQDGSGSGRSGSRSSGTGYSGGGSTTTGGPDQGVSSPSISRPYYAGRPVTRLTEVDV